MKNDQQPNPPNYPRSIKPKNAKHRTLIVTGLVIITLLAIGAAGYGGYSYGLNSKNDNKSETTNTSETTDDSGTQQSATNTSSTFHTVLSVGYPFDTEKTLTTKLGVPNKLQSIAITSDIQDPGFNDILGNNFNAEMGRWIFGNPELSGSESRIGEISIFHIQNEWLQKNTPKGEIDSSSSIDEYDFTTPAKKSSSLARLDSDAQNCAKNSEKGFTISNVLNVCYAPSHIRQSTGYYSPYLNLKGYGLIDGDKYILFGYLRLADKVYGESEADKKADAFASGNIPEETKKLIVEYVDALKNSTISSKKK